jgi:uncharacterized membrane protein
MLISTLHILENAQPNTGDGHILAMTGLILGLISAGSGILLWIIVGSFIGIPGGFLGLFGLVFSIWGYFKARKYFNNRRVLRLAVAGMILNGIGLIGFAWLIVVLSRI